MAQENVIKSALDTNIIVRYLVDDVTSQADEVEKLFTRAEKGEISLIVLPIVVAEVSYVLQTFYHQSFSEISRNIQSLLIQPWLELEHFKALLGLWTWYEQGQHFVDSYLLALKKYENIGFVSFDKKLNFLSTKKSAEADLVSRNRFA
jgi:predicted nucleic acid-binding protein